MRRKVLVFISAAAVLGLLVGTLVIRSASAIDSARTITVIAPDTEQRDRQVQTRSGATARSPRHLTGRIHRERRSPSKVLAGWRPRMC